MAKEISYQKKLERHLSAYRQWRLGVPEKGTFSYRGVTRRYGHILPSSLRWLNILEPFRGEICNYVESNKSIKLHRYFHHLNSSQAFGLNVFYPYLTMARAELARGMTVGPISEWAFEAIPVAGEDTNVDLTLNGNGNPIYIEVKLSEAGFGTAKPDRRHHDKLNSTYRPVLEEFVDPRLLEPGAFFRSYQILRNVWLAARHPKGSVIFFFPRANGKLTDEVDLVMTSIKPRLRSRIRVLYVEDLLRKLTAAKSSRSALSWYVKLLNEKYLPKP